MGTNISKLVTTSHYHLWTDALHARELARQARNEWDRGAYVRWAINTAWTAFEAACGDALGATGIGNRFKDKMNDAVANLSLPALDWGQGLWQGVLKVYELRKDYVHVALPQNSLFAKVSEAEDAIDTLRKAIKAIYIHAGKPAPTWPDDNRDQGWDDGGGQMGIPTVALLSANPSDPDVVKVAHIYRGNEYITKVAPPGTDPEPHIQNLINNTSVPISAIRIYRGNTLLEERAIPMRGS